MLYILLKPCFTLYQNDSNIHKFYAGMAPYIYYLKITQIDTTETHKDGHFKFHNHTSLLRPTEYLEWLKDLLNIVILETIYHSS